MLVICILNNSKQKEFYSYIKYIFFDFLVLTHYFFHISISFFDKGEEDEENQETQCSMEEEITQETGGKHSVLVFQCIWMCICTTYTSAPMCVHAYVAITCACPSLCERDLLCLAVGNYMPDCICVGVCVIGTS